MNGTWLKKVNFWTEHNSALTTLLLLLISILFFSWIQYSPSFADPDSFYHIKVAEMISQHGIVRDFPYLPFTTLKSDYIDHHLLYHIYLVPFVTYLPPLIGAKIAHIILDSILMLVFFWILRRLGVKGAFWFTGLLFLCDGLMFRLNLIKAQPTSIIILLMGTYFMMQKRHWPLLGLSFLYVWFYGGWFLMLVVALIYIFTVGLDRLADQIRLSRPVTAVKIIKCLRDAVRVFAGGVWEWSNRKLFLMVAGGLLSGLIINPYFPQNAGFYWVQIVEIGLRNFQGVIAVGSEWYPYDAWQLFQNASIPLIFYIVSLIIFLSHYRKFDIRAKFLFVAASFFTVATIRSRRNIEYMVPYVVMWGAALLSSGWRIPTVKKDLLAVKDFFRILLQGGKSIRIIFKVIIFCSAVILIIAIPMKIKESVGNRLNFNYLNRASAYLAQNSNQGDIVFNCGWDYFPELFYHNSKDYYIVGLDTTFMYLEDKELYGKWADIIGGKRPSEIYTIIKNDFRAKYVIAKTDQRKVIVNLDADPNFLKVYSDNEALVYKVL